LVIIDIRPEIHKPKIEDALEKAAERTLAIEKSEDCEVSILLTDDDEIQKLNATYREVDAPTDVLAFAMREGTDGDLNSEILGDVVISIQTAKRQAEEYRHSIEAELSLLVIHGILHLLGYDHAEKDETQIMQEKQKEIIYSLGYHLTKSKLMLETA